MLILIIAHHFLDFNFLCACSAAAHIIFSLCYTILRQCIRLYYYHSVLYLPSSSPAMLIPFLSVLVNCLAPYVDKIILFY
jgi:hypothetical protein